MEILINQFIEAQKALQEAVDKFPKEKREEKLFGDWTLKDVIVHFEGWDRVFTDTIDSFCKGGKPEYWGKIYIFNDKAVNKSKNKTWEEIYKCFKATGNEFVEACKKVPKDLYEVKVWKDKIYSPKRILEINIHHYQKAQLIEIKKLLKKWNL